MAVKQHSSPVKKVPAGKKPAAAGKRLPWMEVLTGIAVLMIILKIGLPSWLAGAREDRANAEANKLYYDLTTAKNAAVSCKCNVRVTFEPASNAYTLHQDGNNNGLRDKGESLRRVKLENGVIFNTNAGLSVLDVWEGKPLGNDPVVLSEGGDVLVFDLNGQASSNAAVYLVPKEDIGLNTDAQRAIKIVRVQGKAIMLKYRQDQLPPWVKPGH